MDQTLSSNPFSESIKRFKRRRGYNGFYGGRKNTMRTVTLGGGSPRRRWRIKAVPKPRVKRVISSPLRLWRKLKNAYINMMLHLGGGSNTSINAFGDKRIPMARQLPIAYSTSEFDNRLVLEIYKSLVASRELATI